MYFLASERYGTTKYFQKTETTLNFYTKTFTVGVCASTTLLILQPLIGWAIAFFSGSMHPDTFRSPFRDMYYYFDERVSPAREICFVLNVVVLAVAATSYLLVDLLFMGTCFYVVSLYNHQKIQFIDIEEAKSSINRSKAIVDSIKAHNDILT